MDYNITSIVGIIGLFIGIVGIFIAIYQLSQANKQLQNAVLTNILTLDVEKNDRQETVDRITHEIKLLNVENKLTPNMALAYEEHLNVAMKNWFSSVNKLCFYIKKGCIPEKEWKIEYRSLITEIVESYESFFGPASKYIHIKDINDKLKRG